MSTTFRCANGIHGACLGYVAPLVYSDGRPCACRCHLPTFAGCPHPRSDGQGPKHDAANCTDPETVTEHPRDFQRSYARAKASYEQGYGNRLR